MKRWKVKIPAIETVLETVAVSAEKAISNIRFRYWGRNYVNTTNWKVWAV